MNKLQLAELLHEANRVFCVIHEDYSQVPWSGAPDSIQLSARDGVKFRLANPTATPEQQHKNWVEFKIADGWVFGETKDVEKKTHPCLVPYAELPKEQQFKDSLFGAIVDAAVKHGLIE